MSFQTFLYVLIRQKVGAEWWLGIAVLALFDLVMSLFVGLQKDTFM